MDIEAMRKDFEARFPVPEGVGWDTEHGRYVALNPEVVNSLIICGVRWEAWQAAKEQAAPDGWQLVPKEPTVDMRHAGARSIRFEMPGLVRDIYIATRGYKAMLAAAPEEK